MKNQNLIIALVIIGLIIGTGFARGWFTLSGIPGTPQGPIIPQTTTTAYCSGTGNMQPISSGGTLGAYGCYTTSQNINIALKDFYGSGALKASSYTCNLWEYGSSGGGVSWFLAESDAAGAAPTTCKSNNAYPVGTPMAVEVCEDTAACSTSDYTAQKLEVTCWLPVVGSSLCTPVTSPTPPTGPNGVVPFASASSSTGSVTTAFTLSVVRSPGDADATSPTTLYNTANPYKLWLQWANSTAQFSTQGSQTGFIKNCTAGAPCIGLNGGTASAAAAGFTMTLTDAILGGGATTQPTPVPWGAGFQTWYPLNPALQSGTLALGTLTNAIVVQISSGGSAGTGCVVQGGLTVAGTTVQPIYVPVSSTNAYWVYILPDSAVLQYNSGGGLVGSSIVSGLSLNCNTVFGTSQTATIGVSHYTFFSLTSFQKTPGNLVPETVVLGQATGATNSVTSEVGLLIKQ